MTDINTIRFQEGQRVAVHGTVVEVRNTWDGSWPHLIVRFDLAGGYPNPIDDDSSILAVGLDAITELEP